MSRAVMLVTLTAAVSLGLAQEVRVDYKHACNFSGYKTYRWDAPQHVQFSNVQFPNQLMQDRIVSAVEEALGAKGFRRVEKGEDLLVTYEVTLNPQPRFTTYTDATGPGWGGLGCCARAAAGRPHSPLPRRKPF